MGTPYRNLRRRSAGHNTELAASCRILMGPRFGTPYVTLLDHLVETKGAPDQFVDRAHFNRLKRPAHRPRRTNSCRHELTCGVRANPQRGLEPSLPSIRSRPRFGNQTNSPDSSRAATRPRDELPEDLPSSIREAVPVHPAGPGGGSQRADVAGSRRHAFPRHTHDGFSVRTNLASMSQPPAEALPRRANESPHDPSFNHPQPSTIPTTRARTENKSNTSAEPTCFFPFQDLAVPSDFVSVTTHPGLLGPPSGRPHRREELQERRA